MVLKEETTATDKYRNIGPKSTSISTILSLVTFRSTQLADFLISCALDQPLPCITSHHTHTPQRDTRDTEHSAVTGDSNQS